MTAVAEPRFDIRKDSDTTWEILTPRPARRQLLAVNCNFDLPLDSADTLADYMNSVGMAPDKDTLH